MLKPLESAMTLTLTRSLNQKINKSMKNLVKSFNQFVNEAMHPSDWYEEGLSDCCGASIMLGDICSDCKEHCGVQSDEEDYENEETFDQGMPHNDEPDLSAHDRMYNSDEWVRAQRDAEGLDEAKKKSRKEVMADAKEKYPNLKPGSMKKGLSHMKGKDFKEKAKKNFGWADKPEAAAAAYIRKATGKEPRDV